MIGKAGESLRLYLKNKTKQNNKYLPKGTKGLPGWQGTQEKPPDQIFPVGCKLSLDTHGSHLRAAQSTCFISADSPHHG